MDGLLRRLITGLAFFSAIAGVGDLRASEPGVFEDREATVASLLTSYSSIQRPLVTDKLELAVSAANTLVQLSDGFLSNQPDAAEVQSVKKIHSAASELARATDLDEARVAFIQLSAAVIEIIRSNEQLKTEWQLFFCPMVANQKGFWVQPKGERLANPYMGTSMPMCGLKKPW